MKLTIQDGRDSFYTFDSNRILLLTATDEEQIKQVEFSTEEAGGTETWTKDVLEQEDGVKYVQVPNEFLNGDYTRLVCYAVALDSKGEFTRQKEVFRIKYRPQPEDWFLTYSERVTFASIKALTEQYKSTTKQYMDTTEGFKDNAGRSAELASKYAENNEDVAVEPGKYSAKHWSIKAEAAKEIAVQKATEAGTSEVNSKTYMESAQSAKQDAETAKNDANTILEQVQSKGTEITNFVATSKAELETQKNESVNAVKSVYQTDLNELKGDLAQLSDVKIGNNLLKPTNLESVMHYYDFNDGETIVEYSSNVTLTKEKILVNGGNLYVRQTYGNTNNTFLVYCYSDTEFLGTLSNSLATIGEAYRFTLKPNTTRINIYCNASDINGNQICISNNKLSAFEDYTESKIISDDAFSNDTKKAIADAKKVDDVTDMVHTYNYLNPSLLKKVKYYYDFNDGETKVDYGDVMLTEEKIDIGYSNDLFIYQKYGSANKTFLIYCYGGAKGFLGTVSSSFATMGKTFRFTLKPGTRYIRIYSNASDLKGNQLCISPISLGAIVEGGFIPYKEKAIVDYGSIPIKNNLIKDKVIVNFGDSIFGNRRPPNDISSYISEMTGATVYNCAFGGCRMSAHSRSEFDAFSMYRLAYAIANNDFSVQDAVNVASIADMPSYFTETRALLKSIDFSKVDIVTIAYGTNDFDSNVVLNGNDNNTFNGALKYSIETLLTAFPNLQIVLLGQTYRYWYNNGIISYDSDNHENSNGNKLTDFVKATNDIANSMHLPFIDNYNIGINQFNRLNYYNENDGVHHNENGSKLIAEHIVKELY